jgi:hypothetical protein
MIKMSKIIVGAVIVFSFTGILCAKDFKFVFGNVAVPAPEGYVKVSGKQLYDQTTGYGWVKLSAYDCGPFDVAKSEQTKTSCECKPETKEAPFRVDLPNGVYQVKVYIGHVMPTEGRKVCLAVNGKVLVAPPGAGGWGSLVTPIVPAVVTDGKMELLFFAAEGGRIAVFAAEITEVKDKTLSNKLQQQFEDAPDYQANTNTAK